MKTKFILSLFLTFFLSICAFATEFTLPQQRILGAELPIEIGEVINLSVSPPEPKPEHFISASYHWIIYKGEEELPSKKILEGKDSSIVFGTGTKSGKFRVLVSAVYLYSVKDGDTLKEVGARQQFIRSTVTVGNTQNPDVVEPDKPDDPVLPPGEFGLAEKAYKLALEFGPKTNKAKGAAILSQSFKTTADKKLSSDKEFLQTSAADNTEAMQKAGLDIAEWKTFSAKLQDIVYDLYTNKKLITVTQFSTAWREIAQGLSQVK